LTRRTAGLTLTVTAQQRGSWTNSKIHRTAVVFMSSGNQGGASSHRGTADFDTTHWSVVLAAGHRSSPDSAKALSALCQTYWYPLYAYARRRVSSIDEAQDLTQEFFARLLEKNYVGDADPERGKFRAFLLTVNEAIADFAEAVRLDSEGNRCGLR
jgi:hypothetical protein